jgi:predicted 3-demethylubiquinone-9 3-methyltransferase (glyoxalase superfamily)
VLSSGKQKFHFNRKDIAMQKITPFLWFDGNAEEAANFYISIFKNSKLGKVTYFGEAGPGTKGSVLTVSFQLEGQEFVALNGGPHYKFTPAFSLYVDCETQIEVDTLWAQLLSGGGREDRCGWLTDKYGVSWQVIPRVLIELLGHQDPQIAARAMQAMLQMAKIDIEKLRQAAAAASSTASAG